MALLDVTDLRLSFHTRHGVVRAVGGASFSVAAGETVGLVGESGSGKTVTGLSLLGLLPQPPARIEGGAAVFAGTDLLHAPERELRALRGRHVSMVFQDPMTALNPYLRIGDQLVEPLLVHGLATRRAARVRGLELLAAVGINDPARRFRQHPHECSGGMRQRVMIAMALIARPELLIADEPTTALDVTVQAQILELLRRLQGELGMAMLFITHDLGVVAGMCARVLVMYGGRIVETAATGDLFRAPRHPYTRALQRSIPALQPRGVELRTIPGQPPDLAHLPAGCAFAPRCEFATDACRVGEAPDLKEINPNHSTACLRVQAGEILTAFPS